MNLSQSGALGLKPESAWFLRLDLLRFVASMGIVVLHYSPRLGLDTARNDGLSLWVDVFFVISGIVITQVYLTKVDTARGIWRFLLARLARLAPLHWLLTLAFVAMVAIAKSANIPISHPENFEPSCLPAVFTFTHAVGGCDRQVYNFVSWSISAEYAMYLLFPLIALAGHRFRVLPPLLFGVILAALFRFDPGWFLRTYDFGALRALPGFLLGVSLTLWRTELSRLPAPGTLFAPVMLLMVAAMLTLGNQGLTVILAYLGVVLIAIMDSRGTPGPLTSYLSTLGQLTYSLYMIHPLFQNIMFTIVSDKILGLTGAMSIAFSYLMLPVLIAASYVSLRAIETPARKFMRSFG